MSKKVNKLTTKGQPSDWFSSVTHECKGYPIGLVDIHSDELVVDIGANVGGFYEAWKHRFTKWIAVEPSIYNCEQYLINTGREVEVQKAVWKQSGHTLKLQAYKGDGETPSGNFGVTGFVNEKNKHGWQGDYEEVDTISFDDFFGTENKTEVGLLKIDCEGAEFDFLYKKDLSHIKYIVGEFHNFLFQYDDRGVELLDWISQTHEEIYSEGDGVNFHYVKLFKRK